MQYFELFVKTLGRWISLCTYCSNPYYTELFFARFILVIYAIQYQFLCSKAGSRIFGQALSVDGFTETLR